MHKEPVIGVIGGMGPYAGLDLVEKIFDQTDASCDQDHLPVSLVSFPHRIRDRSTFLLGHTDVNPADAIATIARQLEETGATVAGIPCNTAHAPRILEEARVQLRASGHQIRLLNMIEEAVRMARTQRPDLQRVGVLSTYAVYKFGLYEQTIQATGLTPILPDEDIALNFVNATIFDSTFGIKAHANPVTLTARQHLLDAIAHLRTKGAEAVILGCTELPLAIPEPVIDGIPMIDPTWALAQALIRETYPAKLKKPASSGSQRRVA